MGKSSIKANPKYEHECNELSICFSDYIRSFSDGFFSNEIFHDLYDFYVLHAPIVMAGVKESFGLRKPDYYGWSGSSLRQLESKLLKHSGIKQFVILRSDSIDKTLKIARLFDYGCIAHSRAVLQQSHGKIIAHEDGTFTISSSEGRMICLFRHIRNSLAHNRTYLFDNGKIMLEDGCNKQITARILIDKEVLVTWMRVIQREID